jgi:hypothetical protein
MEYFPGRYNGAPETSDDAETLYETGPKPETSDDAKTVEDDIFKRMGHWVGANGEWIAFAQRLGR